MHARKKPAHVSDPTTKKSRKSVSGKRGRDPREDDKARISSPNVVDPIQRGPLLEGAEEPAQPIVREPDDPPKPEPTETGKVIDRPDDDEEEA